MPPESGGICGRLTSGLPLDYLQGGVTFRVSRFRIRGLEVGNRSPGFGTARPRAPAAGFGGRLERTTSRFGSTRSTTDLTSKVTLPRIFNFKNLLGTNLDTLPPGNEPFVVDEESGYLSPEPSSLAPDPRIQTRDSTRNSLNSTEARRGGSYFH
jgi:hypothetical protein